MVCTENKVYKYSSLYFCICFLLISIHWILFRSCLFLTVNLVVGFDYNLVVNRTEKVSAKQGHLFNPSKCFLFAFCSVLLSAIRHIFFLAAGLRRFSAVNRLTHSFLQPTGAKPARPDCSPFN